jgi:hypothetical protein
VKGIELTYFFSPPVEGFPGPSKIFLLEFSMPHNTTSPSPDPNNPSSPSANDGNDMPAVWLLNARIPYTAQYYNCSCWLSGCGEIDVFEVLQPGDTKARTTVQAGELYGGGDPNWFERPVDVERPIRVAVVMDGEQGVVSVSILPGDGGKGGEFPEELGGVEVGRWMDGDGEADEDDGKGEGSLFRIVHKEGARG